MKKSYPPKKETNTRTEKGGVVSTYQGDSGEQQKLEDSTLRETSEKVRLR